MMHGDLQPDGSPLQQACSALDAFLCDLSFLPPDTNTHGKSLGILTASILICWSIVHFHLGYITGLVLCVPVFIMGALLYTERELRKDD
jgi:hypothetical protein